MSHPVLNPLPSPLCAERILVIRLGALGDVVRTLPAVAALRAHYACAEITWLVEERTEPVVRGRAIVDRALVFPRRALAASLRAGRVGEASGELRRFLGALRGAQFDLVVDFHAIARSAVLSRLSGAPERVSYAPPFARESAWRAATRRAELAPRTLTRFERNAALVRFLGIEPLPESRAYRLDVDVGAGAAMQAALAPGRAPVILHPGSSAKAAHKRWSPAQWVELSQRLAADGDRVLVCVGSSDAERSLAEGIVRDSQGAARAAPPTPDFEALAALLACASHFVSADSGPLHVASLVGTPVVQVLGSTHPVENRPYAATPFRQVSVEMECSPCRRGCAAAACMRSVAATQVHAALRSLDPPSPRRFSGREADAVRAPGPA